MQQITALNLLARYFTKEKVGNNDDASLRTVYRITLSIHTNKYCQFYLEAEINKNSKTRILPF